MKQEAVIIEFLETDGLTDEGFGYEDAGASEANTAVLVNRAEDVVPWIGGRVDCLSADAEALADFGRAS